MDKSLNERSAQHPSLYQLAADGRSLDFRYTRCSACQRLSFSSNAPGCMHCGAPLDGAERVTQAGGGTLLEFVTLHVALRPGMVAPSIAGDIRLADGIVEEGVIAVDDESRLAHGMALRAIAVPLPTGEHYTCRFVPAEELAA